jgi:hypothetical protein
MDMDSSKLKFSVKLMPNCRLFWRGCFEGSWDQLKMLARVERPENIENLGRDTTY